MEQYNNLPITRYRGRLKQLPIYLGKLFRQFLYMNDWKVIPMSALVALLVSIVVSKSMFSNMEGITQGGLALACICIWNGFFNSIQSVCRERDVVKREHRNGMHITAYIGANMIYQALICIAQVIITIAVCGYSGMDFPTEGVVFNSFLADLAVTLFLITYSADMMALMISCIAKNTTAAMTIMPFMLIFELVFSNVMFSLGKTLGLFTKFSIARWGSQAIISIGNYNSLPMRSAWTMIKKFTKDYPDILTVLDKSEIGTIAGKYNQNDLYVSTLENVVNCWVIMILLAAIFVVIGIIALRRIDKDKR